jgi:hypothetical protein
MTVEPRTEAGRTFLEMLTVMDSLDDVARKTPVDWAHGILEIEKQARAAALREVAEKVERLEHRLEFESSWADEQAMYECVSLSEVRAILTEATGASE